MRGSTAVMMVSDTDPMSHRQVEGAERVHKEEMRLQMDVAIGKAPPLTEDQMQHRLREEAQVCGVHWQQWSALVLTGSVSSQPLSNGGPALLRTRTITTAQAWPPAGTGARVPGGQQAGAAERHQRLDHRHPAVCHPRQQP